MLTARVVLRLLLATVTMETVLSQAPRPPSFTETLSKATQYFSPNDGEILTLPCVANGLPAPDYEWYFNGALLADKPMRDGTLVLMNPQKNRQGYYQCVARNSIGSAMSNKTLVKQASQAAFDQTTIPVKRTATVGQKLVLPCTPRASAVPTPRNTFHSRDYDWKFVRSDGSQESSYPLGRRVQIDDNGNLNIAYVTMTDNRPDVTLTCFITNRISNINVGGSEVVLTVTDTGTATALLPSIMFYPNQTMNADGVATTVVALESRDTSLRCFFSGGDNVEIAWRKKNGQIPTDGRVEQLNLKIELLIKSVQKSDEGEYICTGSGTGGSTDFPINVIVQAAPVFKFPATSPVDVNTNVGDDVIFQCNPYAIPEATVEWFKNGVKLDPAQRDLANKFRWSNNNRMLTVLKVCKNNCSASDNGPMVIQCNASNVHGYAFANGFINVFVRTVLTTKPQSVIPEAFGETFNFSASATTDPNTPYELMWYFRPNEQAEWQPIITGDKYTVSADGSALTIPNVGQSEIGQYRVIASNKISQDIAEFSIAPPPAQSNVWPFWWIPLIIILIVVIFIIIVCCICCCIYRNRGDEYPVDEKERAADRDPEQELVDNGFHDYQRSNQSEDIEKQPLTYGTR